MASPREQEAVAPSLPWGGRRPLDSAFPGQSKASLCPLLEAAEGWEERAQWAAGSRDRAGPLDRGPARLALEASTAPWCPQLPARLASARPEDTSLTPVLRVPAAIAFPFSPAAPNPPARNAHLSSPRLHLLSPCAPSQPARPQSHVTSRECPASPPARRVLWPLPEPPLLPRVPLCHTGWGWRRDRQVSVHAC